MEKYLRKKLGKFKKITSPISNNTITAGTTPPKNHTVSHENFLALLGKIPESYSNEVTSTLQRTKQAEEAPKIMKYTQRVCATALHTIWREHCRLVHM